MRLEHYSKVQSLVEQIRDLDRDIELAQGKMLCVNISGRGQDDDIVGAAREAVIGKLVSRKIDKLNKLKDLGVDVGDLPPEPITDWFRLDMLDSLAKESKITIDRFPLSDELICANVERTSLPSQNTSAHDSIRDLIDDLIKGMP